MSESNSNEERQGAELDFVRAAYSHGEAWCSTNEDGHSVVHRRLIAGAAAAAATVCWELQLHMPPGYPGDDSGNSSNEQQDGRNGEEQDDSKNDIFLQVNGLVDQQQTAPQWTRVAFSSLPRLLQICRDTALANPGQEAIFSVLNAAEEWIEQGCWDETSAAANKEKEDEDPKTGHLMDRSAPLQLVLGRRLIYSHHIISKRKRADMHELAKDLNLTGFLKIGWPGLIIIEGLEEDCRQFYDTIRAWSWQYLVVRGEMQEPCGYSSSSSTTTTLDKARRFAIWKEVDDMALVSTHCREVGLEALKIYGSSDTASSEDGDTTYAEPNGQHNSDSSSSSYGALVHVDHMNNGKAYRKWLRKACRDQNVSLLIQQCYPHDDYSKKPIILAGLVGQHGNVAAVLKQWRTRRVDLDSRGKPCLEREMTVLLEGLVVAVGSNSSNSDNENKVISWDDLQTDDRLNTTPEKLCQLLGKIGGDEWVDAASSLWR